MDDNLFHYTTFDVIENILNNNYLRFTRVDKVTCNTDVGDLKRILNNCFEIYKNKLESINLNKQSIIEEFFEQRTKSYIFCASHNNRNNYLWDKYANNGRDLCIEFNKNNFPFSPGRSCDLTETFAKVKMIYGEYEFINEFESWLNTFINNYNTHASRQFILMLSILADSYKKLCFSKEDEVRIVYFNKNVGSVTEDEFPCQHPIYTNATQTQRYKINIEDPAYLYYKLCYDLEGREWGIHRSIVNIHVRNSNSYNKIKNICCKFSNIEVKFTKD